MNVAPCARLARLCDPVEYVCYSLNLHRTAHYIDNRRLVSKWRVGKTTNTTVE